MAKLRCESEKKGINSRWRRRRAVYTCAVKLIHFLWKISWEPHRCTDFVSVNLTFSKEKLFLFFFVLKKKKSNLFIWICTNAYLRLTNATDSSPPPTACASHVHRRHILFFDVKFDCLTNWFQFFVLVFLSFSLARSWIALVQLKLNWNVYFLYCWIWIALFWEDNRGNGRTTKIKQQQRRNKFIPLYPHHPHDAICDER